VSISQQNQSGAARGFIRVARGLRDHFKPSEQFSEYEAWLDLVETARGVPSAGLERGQLQGSYSEFAARWNWSRDRVRRFIEARQSVLPEDPTHLTVVIPADTKLRIPPVYEVTNFQQYNGTKPPADGDCHRSNHSPRTAPRTAQPAPVVVSTVAVAQPPPQSAPQAMPHIKEERTILENGKPLGRLSAEQLHLIWGPIAQTGRNRSLGRDTWEAGTVAPRVWDGLQLVGVDGGRLIVASAQELEPEARSELERAITRAAEESGRLRGRRVEVVEGTRQPGATPRPHRSNGMDSEWAPHEGRCAFCERDYVCESLDCTLDDHIVCSVCVAARKKRTHEYAVRA